MEKRDLRVIGDEQFELWAFTEDLQHHISVSIIVFKNREVIGYVWIRPNLHRAIFSSIQRLQESPEERINVAMKVFDELNVLRRIESSPGYGSKPVSIIVYFPRDGPL